MQVPARARAATFAIATIALFGCGGGGSGSGDGGAVPPATNAAVGGIWEGTVTVAGQQPIVLVGLVAEDGRGHFIQEDGVQYWGTVRSSGNRISASIDGALALDTTFLDGSTSGSGSIEGSIVARNTISASSVFTTTRGTRTTGTISLQYNAAYERDSSLTLVAGNYTNALFPGSDVLNVNSDGVLFGQAPGTGCVVNGRVRTIDMNYNAYEIQYSFSNCTGGESTLNGSAFSGIATLDDMSVPEMAIAGVQGRVGGVLYSYVFAYERT